MIMEATLIITATISRATIIGTTTGREVQMKEPKPSIIEEFNGPGTIIALFLHATSVVKTTRGNAEMALLDVSIVDKKVII